MHKLARQVRFSINPFLLEDSAGSNPFASQPAGEGLSLFFELCTEVVGDVDPATGFVVNVADIDARVREFVVPIFADRIKQSFRRAEHIDFLAMAGLLGAARGCLSDKFGMARLGQLSLKLNPFRKITIGSEGFDMVYFSEKFEFAATHKLWNDSFSQERNLAVFGKCANPTGHGHNYIIEVTIEMPAGESDFRIGDFEKIVDDRLIRLLDHRNLNVDVEWFRKTNPTVENITGFAWDKLVGKFGAARLHCVTVWETDKTYCSYYGR